MLLSVYVYENIFRGSVYLHSSGPIFSRGPVQKCHEFYTLTYFYLDVVKVLASVLVCDTIVSEFEIQSLYYVPFQTNILGTDRNLLISQAMS